MKELLIIPVAALVLAVLPGTPSEKWPDDQQVQLEVVPAQYPAGFVA